MQTVTGKQYFEVRDFSTVPLMLAQSVELYKDMPAIRHRIAPDREVETITYGQLQETVQFLQKALVQIGACGGRIAIVGENSSHWIISYLAAVSGIGVVVPLDRLLPEAEIVQLLQRGKVDTVFYDSSFCDLFAKLGQTTFNVQSDNSSEQNSLGDFKVKNCICMRTGRLKEQKKAAFDNIRTKAEEITGGLSDNQLRFFDFEDLLFLGKTLNTSLPDYQSIDPDALMALLFTSGTTSISKGVMLSQRNVCSDVKGIAGMVKLDPGLRMLSILPLHHTFENTCGMLVALYVGACIHVCDGLRYIQKNMQEYAIEMIIGVPAVFENFYQKINDTLAKTGKTDLVRRMRSITRGLRKIGIDLRGKVFKQIIGAFGGSFCLGICGAAPIDPEIISFFDDIGVRILQGYGLTETSPVASGCNSKIFVPGTVGQPVSGITLAVASEVDGEPGEILVKGPIVMLGYYENDEASAEAIDEHGWFHTGDIGVINPKNKCLTITGRKKSMIVLKSGKKVFPEEVEQLINQFDFIKESMVWGDQTDDGDVVVSAKFVLDEKTLAEKHGLQPGDKGVALLLEQLVKDVNQKMPSFKSIRQHVYGFSDMVKTTTLKIKRQIEIEKLKSLMEKGKLRWRELSGKNIDSLDNQQDDSDEDKQND